MLVSFLRTSITEYIPGKRNQDWLYSLSPYRMYFDNLIIDVLNKQGIDMNTLFLSFSKKAIAEFRERQEYILNNNIYLGEDQIYSGITDNDYLHNLNHEIIDASILKYIGRHVYNFSNSASESIIREEIMDEFIEKYYDDLVSVDNKFQTIEKRMSGDIYRTFKYGKNNQYTGASVKTDYGYVISFEHWSNDFK